MKWPPSEFWAATPYDCLLAAGGMAAIRDAGKASKFLSKKEVKYWQDYFAKEKLKNGKG